MNVVLSNYDISLSYINYVPSKGILAWTRLDLFNYMLNPKSSYIQSLSKSSPASAAKWTVEVQICHNFAQLKGLLSA